MTNAIDLLKTRRSVKPMELTAPGPNPAELQTLLTIASRVPDHGKLAPWRFVVFEGEARKAAGEKIAAVFKSANPQASADQIDFERNRLARAPLVVAVVSRAGPHVKIPLWEQELSSGAAAMNLVTAAHALGYAASWLTEWYAYDRAALDALGLAPNEKIAGFVHIGTPAKPPEDRPRPDLSQIVSRYGKLSMFYDTRTGERPLKHDPFKAIVAPRPVGWITSISAKGEVNLAPYSYFNGVLSRPNLVMFSSEGFKDSVSNVRETGEFVCNLATWDLREAMNATSAPLPHGVNEMERAGLAPAPSKLVKPPRVAAAPCALECKLLQIVALNDLDGSVLDGHVVIGRVVGVHIDDRFIKDGKVDTAAMKPIARCGYLDEYAVVEGLFHMTRPTA